MMLKHKKRKILYQRLLKRNATLTRFLVASRSCLLPAFAPNSTNTFLSSLFNVGICTVTWSSTLEIQTELEDLFYNFFVVKIRSVQLLAL